MTSETARARMRSAATGRRHSAETIAKLSGPRPRHRKLHVYDPPHRRYEEPILPDFDERPTRRTAQQQRARLELLRDRLRTLKPTASVELREGLQRTIAELETKVAA